ncbi:MAG: hydrogenase maturation protease [Methylococcaceae bacterium]|jgi:hydrogenase 3 maturation protease
MSKRHIVCFGNELQGDDGFGIHIYRHLCQHAWPPDVGLFNAGIAGLNAIGLLEDCQQAILVDALSNFGNVGEVFILTPEDLAARPQAHNGHGLGIPYLLEALNVFRTPLPEILIVGVEVAAIKPFSLHLSHQTELAVKKTVHLIRGLLPI